MRIVDVQACVIGRPEPHSGGSVWTFVRIYTGECNSAGPGASGFATREIIMALRGFLIGQDPLQVGPLWEEMRRRNRYGGANQPPFIFALTGIEHALMDIMGKALGLPVYRLLGGKYRDAIRLYADCHAGETADPQAYADKARATVEAGFNAVKFDVDHTGQGLQDPANRTVGAAEMTYIVDLIATLRDALGPDVDLAIDCHGQFDLPSAITLAKAVEPLRLMWLEEPVPAENPRALAQVRRSSSTVICTGENQYTRWEFLDLFRHQAVDIIMPDLAKVGGMWEARRVADLADAHYIPVAPHNVSSPLGMMAAGHVLASIPNFQVLEFHARGIPWWQDLCTGAEFFAQAGVMQVPDRPGIGIELDDDAARSLLWGGSTYFTA